MATMDMLPIGIENFEKIRTQGFYYVDKTELIKELLESWSEVNLFTRPRRFGKSLNMSMLKYFFEYGCDAKLFEGLTISREVELCEKHMGKYPVVSISLKGVEGLTFDAAKAMLRNVIGNEAQRLSFLGQSKKLNDHEKERYCALTNVDAFGSFTMSDEALQGALQTLSSLLCQHYNQKVVLLIDEYDVPLDKAQKNDFYPEMVNLIRSMFGAALKTNSSLQFAVLTGCLRISKESIFTGLNNFKVRPITDVKFDEYFGFVDDEVQAMLAYYGQSGHYPAVKEWYDGYRFGNVDVYCPWDVINYVDDIKDNPRMTPQAYWVNASGNDIVRNFLRKADSASVKMDIERLVAGGTVQKEIHMELTYDEMYSSIDNVWSVLFMTGYLTQVGEPIEDIYTLRIPNLEVRKIFTSQIYEWFKEDASKDGEQLKAFCDALESGDAARVETEFNAYLAKSISIRDTFVKKQMKENFYHGILLGILGFKNDWAVASNKESGQGYSDIQIEIFAKELGIIIEVKYPDGGELEAGCQAALAQIENLHYDEMLRMNGSRTILKYGIACHLKRCKVAVKKD